MFRTREIFSKRLGEGEEFDAGCLCISSFSGDGRRFIIVGSFAGVLRIFDVPATYDDAQEEAKCDDTPLLEARLNAPILQVSVGRFAGASEQMCLAILQPRKLVIQEVSTKSDSPESLDLDERSKSCFRFTNSQEHALPRAAVNMVCGVFGGSVQRAFVCVQSVDCTLTIYDRESIMVTCFLSDCLLPSAFGYLRSTDSFVLVHGDELRCFKHRTLIAAGSKYELANTNQQASDSQTNRPNSSIKAKADWSVVMGDRCVDLAICNHLDTKDQSVLCVTEQHVFCVSSSGNLQFMHKLNYQPVSLCVYGVPRGVTSAEASDGAKSEILVNYIIGTRSRLLLIFENCTLKWACRADFMPVQITVTNLSLLYGVLVLLSEFGKVTFAFLGTEPCVQPRDIPTNASLTSVQQAEIQHELQHLQNTVVQLIDGNQPTPQPSNCDELLLQVNIAAHGDALPSNASLQVDLRNGVNHTGESSDFLATVHVVMKTRAAISQVHVDATCRPPFRTTPKTMNHFHSAHPGLDHVQNSLTFALLKDTSDAVPIDLRVAVCATYTSNAVQDAQGHRVVLAYSRIPFICVASLSAPQRDALFKVAFHVDDKLTLKCDLPELFRDVCGESTQEMIQHGVRTVQNGSSIGLRLHEFKEPVTFLYTRNKFCVQCDRADLLYLPLKTLLDRLCAIGGVTFSDCQLQGQAPIEMLEEQIQASFEARKQTIKARAKLDHQAAFLLEVQKRAFALYLSSQSDLDDGTSVSLADLESSNLESLLDDSHNEVMRCAHQLQLCADKYSVALGSLESTLRLVALCVQMQLNLNCGELRALENALLVEHIAIVAKQPLCVAEIDTHKHTDEYNSAPRKSVPGWEELEDAVLVYELRQSTGSAADTELDLKMPRSINNLIEHLREFFQLVLHKQLTMAQLGAQMSTAAQLDTFSNESATSRRNAPRSNRENFSNVFPTQSLPGRSIDVEQTNPRSLPSNLFGGVDKLGARTKQENQAKSDADSLLPTDTEANTLFSGSADYSDTEYF